MIIIEPGDVVGMQRELFNNGPITVAIDMYEDFVRYKSGIYYKVSVYNVQNFNLFKKWTSGKNLGKHSVRLIGWVGTIF
jgi:hypothetical protein